ncbi:hypothetical protein FDP41_013064 [Naegleria fowleri]|uniref:Uncharacterized protein n=1 Tax=Naegleria fowleri TaxID=5763 RepID=A0A6A5C0X7_NAEFO|nr:uncharacterized protein FDP41_013064 [Naegleria fowleri]KAF0980581.1 hypothetical protein FDP41_013064 [Naegleria fowleri]
MVLSSAATTSTTDHEAPSSFTLALIKSHPRKLMLYWLSCVVKFTFAIIVFAVAINTFVALGDVDELEKYDKALSSKLTAFMVGVSLLHLFTGTVMVIGSVCGIVASLYPGSKPSNVVSDSTGLSIHGSGAAVGDYGQSLGSAVDQANRNLWNPIFISRALKTANLRYYCSIVWLVCSVLTILFQVGRTILASVGVSVMHIMIERFKSMPELDVQTDVIILILTSVIALAACSPFIVLSFIATRRIRAYKKELEKQQELIKESVMDDMDSTDFELNRSGTSV